MKAQFKHFIVSAILVFVSVITMDCVVGLVGDHIVPLIPNCGGSIGSVSKDYYRLNRLTADIVIIGSSRGSHHYVSTMLRDSISHFMGGDYTLYNGSIAGRFINCNSCAAESIMDRYSPKLLIFEVSEDEFSCEKAKKDLKFMAINYRNNRFVNQYINDFGWKERVKVSLSMYRFNRQFLNILVPFLRKSRDIMGYDPLFKTMTLDTNIDSVNDETVSEIDNNSLNHFMHVLSTAEEKGIPLVIVTSPKFQTLNSNVFLTEICREFGIPYLDLHNLDLFNSHPEYFYDVAHLNDEGAHVFTSLFFEQLKTFLPLQNQ